MIITGDDTGLIKVWSASTGLLITSLKGHTLAINAMEMNHSNEYLASCSGDGFVLVWDVRTGRPLTALKEDNDDPILILLFYREVEEFLVAASEKGNLYVYPLRDIIKCQGGRLGTQYNRHLGNGGVTHSCTIRKMCVKPAR
jgi:bromodomain and WD repeat domain-containing protein 1/3